MNKIQIVLVVLLSFSCFAQEMTYSPSEGKRFQELGIDWGAASTYNSKQYFVAVIDSLNQFLEKYPNSAYKIGILNYKLDLVSSISSDSGLVGSIADSILYYDSIPQTKLGISEIFIRKNINAKRGADLIEKILPLLTFNRQRCLAFILLAKYEISKGDFLTAKSNLLNAIQIDSTRYEAWFSYLSILRFTEDEAGMKYVEDKINQLEENDLANYGTESKSNPNLFKNINKYSFTDMNGKLVKLSSFKNKVMVINYFAFWCGVCTLELPVLNSLSREFPNVIFLYLNAGGPIGGNAKDTKKRFLKQSRFQFLRDKMIVFPENNFTKTIDISGVPTTFIVDKKGVIRFEYIGYTKGAKEYYSKNVRQLLNEK